MSKRLVRPTEIPLVIRRTLVVQCDGEWERVTTDGAGGYIVHNNAMKAAAYCASTTVIFQEPDTTTSTTAPPLSQQDPWRPPAVVKRTAPRRKAARPAELRALASVLAGEGNRRIQPGVNVISAQDRSVAINEWLESCAIVEIDWAQVGDEALDLTAHELLKRCEHGLPPDTPFLYHPEVLAMEGFKDAEDEVRSAIRYPDRVEIRPETGKKHYPILGFWRGDVNVILGMRNPSKPAVIAAYYSALLMHDVHRVNNGGGAGGSKRTDGPPKSPGQVITQLRALGADIERHDEQGVALVSYSGNQLGKISLGRVQRNVCETDWQRMQRKINAIKQREGAA